MGSARRAVCRVFGHPGWRPVEHYRLSTLTMYLGGFNPRRDELQCVRCHALHPDDLARYVAEAGVDWLSDTNRITMHGPGVG
jgi:hypothetical protein